jgi:hypothetical protein
MLSLADLAREASRQQKSSSPQITDADVNDTLAAICSATAALGRQERRTSTP